MSNKLPALLPIIAALTLAACGGGGGGRGDSPAATTSGRAVDGYLSGSTVFCDANKNGVLDGGEVSGTTDTSGNFSLPGACAGLVVVSGGTDTATGYSFKGLLKSAAGSAYVTPLTTLLADTGLTEAQLNTALGLPANTSVGAIDPMANETVLRRTLAIQQTIQQVANSFGTQATPGAVSALYAKVASALAQTIRESSGTPLFSTSGTIDAGLIQSAIRTAVSSINADNSLPDVTLTSDDIAALSTGVVAQAEQFLQVSQDKLASVTKTLQNPLNPPVDTATAAANYIYPRDNSFVLNGVTKTLAQFASPGVSTTGLTTIGLEYGAVGTPNVDALVDVAMSLESTTDSRIIQVKTEQVHIKRNTTSGAVTVEVVPETQVHIYARDQRGIEFNTSLSGLSFNPLTDTDNKVSVNYATLVDRVVKSAQNNSPFTADQFKTITGTFNVKFAVSTNLNVRYQGGERLPMVNVGIYKTTKGVEGPGIVGKLTIN